MRKPDKQKRTHACRQTGRGKETVRKTSSQPDGQREKNERRYSDSEASRQTDRNAGRQLDYRQAGMQAGRQTGRQADTYVGPIVVCVLVEASKRAASHTGHQNQESRLQGIIA